MCSTHFCLQTRHWSGSDYQQRWSVTVQGWMNQCHVRDDRAGQEERCGISRPRLSFSLILVLPGFFLSFLFFSIEMENPLKPRRNVGLRCCCFIVRHQIYLFRRRKTFDTLTFYCSNYISCRKNSGQNKTWRLLVDKYWLIPFQQSPLFWIMRT